MEFYLFSSGQSISAITCDEFISSVSPSNNVSRITVDTTSSTPLTNRLPEKLDNVATQVYQLPLASIKCSCAHLTEIDENWTRNLEAEQSNAKQSTACGGYTKRTRRIPTRV